MSSFDIQFIANCCDGVVVLVKVTFPLKELVCIVEIHSKATKNNFAWAELEEAKIALMDD
jgi:hypothetical protein